MKFNHKSNPALRILKYPFRVGVKWGEDGMNLKAEYHTPFHSGVPEDSFDHRK